MASKTFTYTPPGEIDGEPDEVAALVVQQLITLATVTAVIAADSYKQLRAEGLDHFETLEEWEASPAGRAADAVRVAGLGFAASIRHLGLIGP